MRSSLEEHLATPFLLEMATINYLSCCSEEREVPVVVVASDLVGSRPSSGGPGHLGGLVRLDGQR